MNLNWAQISDTLTTQLTAFGLKAAGAIAVWIIGRYLICRVSAADTIRTARLIR